VCVEEDTCVCVEEDTCAVGGRMPQCDGGQDAMPQIAWHATKSMACALPCRGCSGKAGLNFCLWFRVGVSGT
jgi:hypothetical protein